MLALCQQSANGDGQVVAPDSDPNPQKDQLNPYFCGNTDNDACRGDTTDTTDDVLSYDAPGRRLRSADNTTFAWFVNVAITL